MKYFEPPEPNYDAYSNRRLLAVPIVLVLLAILVLVGWSIFTGVPIERGITFTGGTEVRVTVDGGVDEPQQLLEDSFRAETDSITSIPGTDGYIVTFQKGDTTPEQLEQDASGEDNIEISQLSQISASLGNDAQLTALYGILIAFGLMAVLVTALFRSIIPAVVILLSAVGDMLVPLAAMNLVGIELSLGTVGALLMLIGYSVDSDILLNKYVLRSSNQGKFVERVHEAMRTGITMTVTSLSAMVVMFVLATAFGVGLLADMGFVLAVGLLTDLVNTYMMNVSILRWYVNRGDSQ